jgi:penicillin-binding protein 1C
MGSWLKKYRYVLMTLVVCCLAFLLLPVVEFEEETNTILETRDGVLLSARITSDGQWRFPPCDSVPCKLRQCILYFEDEYFPYHPGVNPVSLSKAMVRNISAGRIVSGGSTISMQVVRLSRKGKPRTLTQKVIEMVLAIRLELGRNKEEILELYASYAPFGGNVVGIDAAAWRYYGRPAYQLSWGEAATLAVLPNAPALIYPGRNQEDLKFKRDRLLHKLEVKGLLDPLDGELARSEPLPSKPFPLPQLAPHLLDRAEKEGLQGTRVHSTINLDLQEKVSALVERHHQHLKQNEIHNAAVLVIRIPERQVVAYVGNTQSADEANSSFVDIIDAPRSTGSILKPLLYTFMLDGGEILPDILVPDIPTHISGYSPLNFDRTYSGAVPASAALVRSLNVPAVRMLQSYGLEKFHSRLNTLGFSTIGKDPGHYGLTLILGGAEVTLWDLCRVYTGMASNLNNFREYSMRYDQRDYDPPLYVIDAGQPEAGPAKAELKSSGIMSAASIWQCFETLTELERPTQEGAWERFSSTSNIGWKTGTSFGYRDAWSIGITPGYLVGVWVGNADGEGRPGLTGVNVAAPLMFDVFSLLPFSGWFETPDEEMTEIEICRKSGFRAGPDCQETEIRVVPEAGKLVEACPYHRTVHLDQSGQFRVNSSCYETSQMVRAPWFVLPPVMEWYYKRRDPHYRVLPPFLPACADGNEAPMELIYPQQTRQVFIPRELDGQLSRLVFEAAHRESGTAIYWHLDDQYLGETSVIHQLEFLAPEGPHTLTLVDSHGNLLEKHFEVVGK